MAPESEQNFFELPHARAHQAPHAVEGWEPSPVALSTESDEYQIIFELAGCGMAQADPATLRLTRVNRRLCQWLGYAPDEMAGGDIRGFVHPEDRESAGRDLERLLCGELPEYVAERRYLRKSGEPLWVEVSVTLLRDAAGRPQRVVTVFHDITERKQVESALRSVALFPEQNPAPVVRATPEGRLIYANPPAQAMLARMGWREGEPLPGTLRNVIAAAVQAGAMREHEFFDGGRFMSVQCLPLAAEGYVNLYGRDVTERRRAEEALRESEAHAQRRLAEIQSIYDNAPVGLCIFDTDLRYVRINERLAEINGIPASEHLGRTLREVVPSLADQAEPVFRRILETGEPVLGLELVGETAARPGVIRIWNENYSPLRDASGKVVGISVMVEDITERRRAEEALRAGNRRFAEVLDATGAGYYEIASDYSSGRVSARFAEILGYTLEELPPFPEMGRWFHSRFPEEDRAELVAAFERFLSGETSCFDLEYRLRRKDDSWVWVRSVACSVEFDAQGRVAMLGGLLFDIDARKRAGLELKRRMEEIQALMDVLPVGVLIAHDPECRHVTGNPAAYRILRLPQGVNLSMSAPSEERPLFLPVIDGQAVEVQNLPLQRAARGERVKDVEASHTHADGSRLWALVFAEPLLDEQGRPRGAVSAFIDTTQSKRAEEALRRSEAQFRLLAEAAPQMVWVVDGSGGALYANGQWDAFFGFTFQDACRDEWRRAVHPEDLEHNVQAFRFAASGGTLYEVKCRLRRRDGEYRWHLIRGVPVKDEAGTITHWYGTNTDIDDLKRAAEELQEADRRKDEYLAMLAHELRNPLAPINNAVQVLKLAGDNMELRGRQWDIIERQVAHMARLLDDLLDVARVTRGKIELRRRPLALGEALRRAVELTLPGIESRRHKLEFQPPPEGLRVEGDLDRLIQIIGNLLGNAAKFTPPGGRLWLSAAQEDGSALIRVRDSGIGIDPEMLPRIFDLFTQVQSSTSRSQGGLGIGLTMARSLVQMHGGAIEVQSDGLGRGSEFIVRLPALPPEQTEPPGPAPEPRRESAKNAKAPRRVLIVDDAADAANSLNELLSRWGHQVRISHNGPEALSLASAFEPEFVLLDIGLPDMDGYEIARRLRQNHPVTDMTLVAITGYSQASDRERAREAGFDHHLVKPVNLRSLRELLSGPSPA